MHHHRLLHLHTLSPHTPPLPIIKPYFSNISYKHPRHHQVILPFSCLNSHRALGHGQGHGRSFHGVIVRGPPWGRKSGRNDQKWRVSAMEREPKFEIDPDKARQALNELDQQLETLSMKQVNPPKIRATSLNSNLKEQMKNESTEISGSFLAFTAFGLFAFSIFYNVLFLTVIKPSIDGP